MKKLLAILLVTLCANLAFAGDESAKDVQGKTGDKVDAERDISRVKPEDSTIQRDAEWEHHQEFLRYLDTHDQK